MVRFLNLRCGWFGGPARVGMATVQKPKISKLAKISISPNLFNFPCLSLLSRRRSQETDQNLSFRNFMRAAILRAILPNEAKFYPTR